MCDADTTPYLVFSDSDQRDVVSMYPERPCRKWDHLVRWANNYITLPFDKEMDG